MLNLRNFVKRLFGFTGTSSDDYTERGRQLSNICFRGNELIATDGHVLAIMDLSGSNEYHNTNSKHPDVLMKKETLEKIFKIAKSRGKKLPQEIHIEQTSDTTIFSDVNSAPNIVSLSHPREDVYPSGINSLFPKKSALRAEIVLNASYLAMLKDLSDTFNKLVKIKIYGKHEAMAFEIENDDIPNVKGIIMPCRTE